jgi:carbamoyltransferase
VTRLLNMRELEDEGKVMALAAYASPIADEDNPVLAMVAVHDGVIRLAATGARLERQLRRIHWQYPNEQFAYLAQRTVERVCIALARDALTRTGERRIAVAGGVASNITATRLMRTVPDVEGVHVFPHMGDGGLALGAAIAGARSSAERLRLDLSRLDLGPSFDAADCEEALLSRNLRACRPAALIERAAMLIAAGAIVLWFDGRMEFGPRALGHRSVLARPDRPSLRDRLNLVLKRRVWYQPFCPSMLDSEAPRVLEDWDGPSNRHMSTGYMVRSGCRAALAGVIGIDGSCRPQFVPDAADYPFAALLRAVRDRLGAAILLNTSLNIHGEPLVCTPAEAVDVYVRSGADALVLGPFLMTRDEHGD